MSLCVSLEVGNNHGATALFYAMVVLAGCCTHANSKIADISVLIARQHLHNALNEMTLFLSNVHKQVVVDVEEQLD